MALLVCDLGSIARARSVPASTLEGQPRSTVGWVPSAQARTPLGPSVSPNPFGPIGDLRLLPDISTRASVAGDDRWSELDFVLCDMVEVDGRPWECCPRTCLRTALQALGDELGARLLASFEHEFQLQVEAAPGPPLSLEAQRRVDPFPSKALKALVEAGVAPECFVVERSPNQFEVPVAPVDGLAAADRSVTLREVVREVARRQGVRATFVPLLDPAEQGNGVHIHLSLLGEGGAPLLYDRTRPACLSELGASFAAGILAHARALTAVTAPSAISCARLEPTRRSASAVCVGQHNREALLRLPPLITAAGEEPAPQMRLEYRAADAAANPYLALAALIRAGLAGVREGLAPPPMLDRDPARLGPAEAEHYGVGALPKTLDESLRALAEDDDARSWMPPLLFDLYSSVKRTELETVATQSLVDLCRRYAEVY